jgi:hypothetical protein
MKSAFLFFSCRNIIALINPVKHSF